MSENTEAAETVEAVETEAAVPAGTEAVAEAPAPEAIEEPVVEAVEESALEPVEGTDAEDASDTPVPEEIAAVAAATVSQARVFLCERGHRVTALWNTPTVCQGRISRKGPICGRQLYPIADLPEQVQKALNPLKASKKSSKKK